MHTNWSKLVLDSLRYRYLYQNKQTFDLFLRAPHSESKGAGVNFINVLPTRAFFECKPLWQLFGSFSQVTFGFVIFGAKILYEKCAHKTLMKLTPVDNLWAWGQTNLNKRINLSNEVEERGWQICLWFESWKMNNNNNNSSNDSNNNNNNKPHKSMEFRSYTL